jgi:hypothetical protein
MNRTQGILSKAAGVAACCAAAILAGSPAKAQNCPTFGVSPPPPSQHIKIFNDTSQYLFPVLDTGQNPNPLGDIWMQAAFSVPNSKTPFGGGKCSYGENLDFRIYINEPSGIAPGGSVDVTVPLFNQLIKNPDPTQNNQWVDWWRGENIWIYANSAATPPRALQEYHDNPFRTGTTDPYLPGQQPLTSAVAGQTFPTCTYTPPNSAPMACVLDFFKDPASLPINGPGQLFEATLGARVEQKVDNDSPPNALDTQNADFDVSYVDVAYMTGAMGPFMNDQVGYVGSPLGPDKFQNVLVTEFLTEFPNWPQFLVTYADGTKETISKLASPSNALARLTGANAPADLPLAKGETWPTSVWGPIQALRDNWTTWAGLPVPGQSGQCANPGSGTAAWCKAVLDVKTLFQANYQQYLGLFANGTCKGTPIPNTDPHFGDRFLAHVYGWTPWIEAGTGAGCSPTANLLQNTPGYPDNGYALYSAVKLEFDNLEYGKEYAPPPSAVPPGVVFNPWVQFLHGANYLNIPGVYAYSVDDAVGNIQAEATGYIIDVGSLKNLENQLPAAPPITVALGYDPTRSLNYVTYQRCNQTTAPIKNVNPSFPSFVLSANAPQNCPVFLTDNGAGKSAPQTYTFTITEPPPNGIGPSPRSPRPNSSSVTPTNWVTFTIAQKDAGEPRWSGAGGPETFDTAKVINCSGNTGSPPNGSSKAWCCDLTTKAGVWAYSFPEPANAHNALVHVVDAGNPQTSNTSNDMTCSQGQ